MRVHLIDGTFELYRAHFSKRPDHKGPTGKDLKASMGVVQSLLGLLEDQAENATHLAVAFDNPIRSFRNDLFEGYKSDAGVPPELRAQFDDVENAVRALGVTVWSMNEFEADDALATAAAKYSADPQVTQVRILTPDKDLGQCLNEKVVQVDRIRQKEITLASFKLEKGFAPESIPDFLGLVGDTADGIPGLDGWGEKGAASVLGAYGHLEEIPLDPSKWKVTVRGAEKLAKVLAAELKEVLLYRTLATLRRDVPLKETLAALEWKGAPKAKFNAWCDEIGAGSVRTRPRKWC